MRLYVAVTDNEWFALHASKTVAVVEEVNFWRPSPTATFKVLQPGEILLFKLHAPDNHIAGGGFFTRFLQMPISMAWYFRRGKRSAIAFGDAGAGRPIPKQPDSSQREPNGWLHHAR